MASPPPAGQGSGQLDDDETKEKLLTEVRVAAGSPARALVVYSGRSRRGGLEQAAAVVWQRLGAKLCLEELDLAGQGTQG